MTATQQITPPQGAPAPVLDLAPAALPRHVAIIMDGNGRWARQRGLPRFAGHRAGAKTVRTIVEECARLGLQQLTLYSFSTENWNRPPEEVALLMDLYVEYMRSQRQLLIDNNIQFAQIGRREGLPALVLQELENTLEATRGNTGMTLCLAINYGSRGEITDAVRAIASEVRAGRLDPGAITEETISQHLYTAGMPDPDLLIRTAGEMRVSNYLLWQISYAEFFVTEVFWPEFGIEQLYAALRNFAGRNRRFGGLDKTNS
ncbi:MAG TPA: isoprenyl transferase [Phycisphaerae bacterium]|nr:isoprenyl transferase [Phycisphaerae bacterium]